MIINFPLFDDNFLSFQNVNTSAWDCSFWKLDASDCVEYIISFHI